MLCWHERDRESRIRPCCNYVKEKEVMTWALIVLIDEETIFCSDRCDIGA
ncbi:hypothetical protein Fmac_018992 [Flemingia macrophylla]|uniref:Uncharacterized protein n=1 Tax=Flemingia macrophylla TaxID=520843 RepID=A0ABD1M6N4_9FABA